MQIKFIGKIQRKEQIGDKFLYNIANNSSDLYISTKEDYDISDIIKGEGFIDNILHNNLIILVVQADTVIKESKMEYTRNIFSLQCTLKEFKQVSNEKCICKYSLIEDSKGSYNVLQITSIVVTKDAIEKIKAKGIGATLNITFKPIIEVSTQNKKRFDMMTQTLSVQD